jgi:proteasome lid subunit RPN8/RPN11
LDLNQFKEASMETSQNRIRLVPDHLQPTQMGRMPLKRSIRWVPAGVEDIQIPPAVEVFFSQRAYIRTCAIAGQDLNNETGGWLLGRHRIDEETSRDYVVIDRVLPAEATRYGRAHLTFTQDSIVAMNKEMEECYPGKELVGWFHTHPHMGVFFSSWDHWLHENFYPAPWQVALVIEPYNFWGGFFLQTLDGNLDNHRYFGFQELTGRDGRSVVLWRNLVPADSRKNGQGGVFQ